MKVILLIALITSIISAKNANLVITKSIDILKKYPDVKRNLTTLKSLNLTLLGFKEGKYIWYMLLVTNPKKPKGAFWFLPHDNENSAFDSAIYAVRKYGGGFLSILSGGKRYHQGQDPNRNFSLSPTKEPSCNFQKSASYLYTSTIMHIINNYKRPNMPYLALHNNTNRGGISILKDSTYTKSYLAYKRDQVIKGKGLADEDNLVYIAGNSVNAPAKKVQKLLNAGLNTKYEYVTNNNNDCSMSNFIVLNYTDNYYNIEAQHGKSKIQKAMIDRLMKIIE